MNRCFRDGTDTSDRNLSIHSFIWTSEREKEWETISKRIETNSKDVINGRYQWWFSWLRVNKCLFSWLDWEVWEWVVKEIYSLSLQIMIMYLIHCILSRNGIHEKTGYVCKKGRNKKIQDSPVLPRIAVSVFYDVKWPHHGISQFEPHIEKENDSLPEHEKKCLKKIGMDVLHVVHTTIFLLVPEHVYVYATWRIINWYT